VVLVGSDDNGRWADVWDGGEITRIAGVQWAGAADDRELAEAAALLWQSEIGAPVDLGDRLEALSGPDYHAGWYLAVDR